MKKIGILTYFWGTNPGTALQAFSSLALIKSMFPDYSAELINYQPSMQQVKYIWNFFKPRLTKYKITTLRIHRKYEMFRQKELLINNTPLITKKYTEAVAYLKEKYDIIIVGSDTIWELEALTRKGMAPFPNIYWLSPELKNRKIAFSVSMGATSADNLPRETLETIKTRLKEFDLIGVRDDLTENAVKMILSDMDPPVIRTPDPTFTYQVRKTGIQTRLSGLGLDLTKKTAGICLPDTGIRRQIVAHFLKKGFQVLMMNQVPELGFRHEDNVFAMPPATPHEWAETFKFLSISITQLFHGTIFSLKNLTPVISIDCEPHRFTEKGESKTLSLLKEFEMSDYAHLNIKVIETDFAKVEESIQKTLTGFNKDTVSSRLAGMEKRCADFIKEAVL